MTITINMTHCPQMAKSRIKRRNTSNFRSNPPWVGACTGSPGSPPAKSLFDQVSSFPALRMEPKRKYSRKRQDTDAVFLFGFYCQLASRRFRIEASTLDSSNAAGCDGSCTKNIRHGQAEMRTQISSFSSRWGRFLASIPLLLLPGFGHLGHLAAGRAKCSMADHVVSNPLEAGKKTHFWFQSHEVCNCCREKFLHTGSQARIYQRSVLSMIPRAWEALWFISKYQYLRVSVYTTQKTHSVSQRTDNGAHYLNCI